MCRFRRGPDPLLALATLLGGVCRAVLESVTLVAGFNDVAVVREADA